MREKPSGSRKKDELNPLERAEIHDKERKYHLQVWALIITSALSVFSVYYSSSAKHTADAGRVELIEENTLDSSPFAKDLPGWQRLEFNFSDVTGALGVRKQLKFDSAFARRPRVKCSLSAINLADLQKVMLRLGYKPSDASGDSDGLDSTSVRVDATSVETDRFELRVSIPMHNSVIQFFRNELQKKELVDKDLATHMHINGEVQHDYSELTPDEIWMINFHRLVGTIDVFCVAQAEPTMTAAR